MMKKVMNRWWNTTTRPHIASTSGQVLLKLCCATPSLNNCNSCNESWDIRRCGMSWPDVVSANQLLGPTSRRREWLAGRDGSWICQAGEGGGCARGVDKLVFPKGLRSFMTFFPFLYYSSLFVFGKNLTVQYHYFHDFLP
jgi:hypothetical protein